MAATVHVVRVFTGEGGRGGNPLGVVLDGSSVEAAARQRVARELGFSETVFVDDAASGSVRIFTPASELPLAGHPLVGTAWLLEAEGAPVSVLRPPAGEVPTWAAEGLTWISARPEDAPDFELRELGSPAEVVAHRVAEGDDLVEVWAWQDEPRAVVRARVFAGALGVPEDEATGAAALRLTGHLGRSLEIRQGRASVIHTRLAAGGRVEVGGRCELVGTRALTPAIM